ncbi:MAG TPA: tetratricopeptide repeat protein [Spirochaetota bacterium]|nr:tetratricopeptide repeat protein [Spirochaetota bacterium]HPS87045.1 tetratricopeptide repeat protein [Spirochaetota bacterium]
MRKKIVITLSVFVSLLLILFFIFVNEMVISIRLNELKTYLQDLDKNEGGVDHIALIATYEIHKKIYEERITQDTADSIEQKVNSLSLPVKTNGPLSRDLNSVLAFPAVQMININRKILGKPPVKYTSDNSDEFKDLDQAYYDERNFLFKRAISQYDKALLNKNLSSTLKASILLRQGYCYALAGINDKAMHNYITIITEYSNESSAITASILVRYLEGFNLARERVLSGETDPVLKSQKLVSLLAYEQALKIINDTEQKVGPKDLPRILYFKARCYSGLGQPEKAVENYLKVITSNPDSPYAKFSNRKLFLIGTSAGGSNTILETSKLINKKLEDPVLDQMIEDRKDTAVTDITIHTPITLHVPGSFAEKVRKMTAETVPVKDIFLVINTSDGNTFKGKLIEKTDNVISIETSIGRIDVKKDKITKVIEK